MLLKENKIYENKDSCRNNVLILYNAFKFHLFDIAEKFVPIG